MPLTSPPTQPGYLTAKHHNLRNPDTAVMSASKNWKSIQWDGDRQAASTQPAAEIVRTDRNKVLCAHITACVCVCLVINTYTTTYLMYIQKVCLLYRQILP